MNFSWQRRENGVHPCRIAQHFCGGDHESLPCAQQHRSATRQRSGPDFRPLKIGENRNRFFVLDGGCPQHRDIFGMLLVRPVGKIEPRHVHPRAQQTINHPRQTARRSDGADNLGMTKTHALFCSNNSRLLVWFTGRRRETIVFFESSRFASLLPYRATTNSAMTRASTSTPLVKDASGIRSSSPCIRRKSSSVSGNGVKP